METATQPTTLAVPLPRYGGSDDATAERFHPGDVDGQGRVLTITVADDMGVWLTAEEAAAMGL